MSKTDWQSLKTEFITNQTHKETRTWLRDVKKWSNSKLDSGNIKQRTVGWSAERAQMQHQIYVESLEQLKEAQKRKVLDVLKAKHKVIDKLVKHSEDSASLKDTIMRLKALQTEIDINQGIMSDGSDTSTQTLNTVRELIDAVNRKTELATLSNRSMS